MDALQRDVAPSRASEDLERQVWRVVDALPQREAIREEDARAWVQEVVGVHGELALWHAVRLGGFGGSEIGALVRNLHGERADHGLSARDIVAAKLMRSVPTQDSAHLRRGHDNEALHAQRFWAKWGAQRDEQAYEALKQAKGSHPWMRYSPDDVVRMPLVLRQDEEGNLRLVRSKKPALWLIDYKAPSQVDPSAKVAFQYAAQLHQGAILGVEAGLSLDGMMLSQFDWANWALKDDVVPWDEQLGADIVRAGDHYWDHVLRAELPPYVVAPKWQEDPRYVQAMAEAARTYAALAALADAARERADLLRSHLLQPLAGKRLGPARIDFEDASSGKILTVAAQRVLDKELAQQLLPPEALALCEKKEAEYDAEAMVRYLRQQGVDLEPFKRRKLDADKVFEVASGLGLDPHRLVREQIVLRVAPAIKQAMQDYLAESYPVASQATQEQDQEQGMQMARE